MSSCISITRIGILKCAAALVVFSILLIPAYVADDAGQTDSESRKDLHVAATIKGTGWKNAGIINMPQSGSPNSSSGGGAGESLSTSSSSLNYSSSGTSGEGEVLEKHWMVGTGKGTKGYSVLETGDGGYIVLGDIYENKARGPVIESRDILLLKTDSNGSEEWNRTIGGDDMDYGSSIQKTKDGGYIIAGLTRSYGIYEPDDRLPDIWLLRTDSNGTELWNRTFGVRSFGGPEFDAGLFAREMMDGGYAVAGNKYRPDDDGLDAWIIKTDSRGVEEWDRTIGDRVRGMLVSALVTDEGEYLLLINERPPDDDSLRHVMLIKTDQEGNDIWTTELEGTCGQSGQFLRASEDGSYTAGGYVRGFSSPWLAKTDSEGNRVWKWDLNSLFNLDPDQTVYISKDGLSRGVATPKWNLSYMLYDFQATRDGGYIILSRNPANEVCLTKLSPDGVMVWKNTYSKSDINLGNSVMETSDGGYIITGSRAGSRAQDLCLMKTDSEGILEWNRIFLSVPGGLEIET